MSRERRNPRGEVLADHDAFERYRDAVRDWDAFAESLSEPLPPCVWANPARVDGPALGALLAEDGVRAVSVPWYPNAFRLPEERLPGARWQYRAGLYQVQEEASLLPVRLLAPEPGDRVLDLCAAPGNKTAQIAFALGNRGTVLANDRNHRRLYALHDVVSRLGLLNVTTTGYDGANYPAQAGCFDRILVDAPCSAEGTVRRKAAGYPGAPADFRRWVAGIQRALLRRAVALCRSGGRVVYATCTFAPEENEAVVDDILREHGGALRLLPARVAGLAGEPGLTAWERVRFSPALEHAVRLWPHLSGTGGFFAAVLERTRHGVQCTEDPAPCVPPAVDRTALLAHHTQRFGLSGDVFEGLRFFRSGAHVRAAAADHRPPAELKTLATGLPFARADAARPKLTTGAALAFAQPATRNVIDLDAGQARAYHARRPFQPAAAQLTACDAEGHVLVRHRGFVLGVGLLRRRDGVIAVRSLFPKAWAIRPPRGLAPP